MKHLKIYEELTGGQQLKSTFLPKFSGLVFIDKPSENYFKSAIRFTLVFIKKVHMIEEDGYKLFQVFSDTSFQRSEDSNGDVYSFPAWDKKYNEDDFSKFDFMTIKDFYNKYTENYKQI